ncbi:hypothetical protein FQN54_004219 [Arachnomyces sp. PD_36]|nr:hypothetical protein FQN54_004219 [Arachnomyces sp. PD_36]
MCTKTKSTWGCGCSAKDKEPIPCDSAKRRGTFCTDIERYVFDKSGDCRACREGRDPIGRGMRGEGRYAQEIKREKRREGSRRDRDEPHEKRGRDPKPRERHEPRGNAKASGSGATKKPTSRGGDDDGPEEITYEYSWDDHKGRGHGKRSKVKDEDVDIVVDLTGGDNRTTVLGERPRRSSFPEKSCHTDPRPGRSAYERSRDEFYRSKVPSSHKNRDPRYSSSYADKGKGLSEMFKRMRDHQRPSRGNRGLDERHGFRNSHRNGDVDAYADEIVFEDDELDFDIGASPRIRSYKASFFSSSHGGIPSYFSRRDDFFDDDFRY